MDNRITRYHAPRLGFSFAPKSLRELFFTNHGLRRLLRHALLNDLTKIEPKLVETAKELDLDQLCGLPEVKKILEAPGYFEKLAKEPREIILIKETSVKAQRSYYDRLRSFARGYLALPEEERSQRITNEPRHFWHREVPGLSSIPGSEVVSYLINRTVRKDPEKK